MKNLKLRMSAAFIILMLTAVSVTVCAYSPTDVQRQSINGIEYIIKTYELPPDTDPSLLIEDDFQQEGFSFTRHTVSNEEITATDIKTVTEQRTAETESKALESALKKLPTTIAYRQDGYAGILILDTGSISTEVAGYSTKTATVSTTKTYPSLMYQDPSMIPQTAVKDGMTLPLSDVSWSVTGTSLAGDSLVPTEYTATAVYSKSVSSSVPKGYVCTADYTGEVSKTDVTGVIYTITYMGTPIPEPEAEPEPEPEAPAEESASRGGVIAGVIAILSTISGVAVFLHLRSRQGVAIYNLMEDDYLFIGRQKLDPKNPVIDLNPYNDVLQSHFFSFVLDKSVTRRLFGRHISATLDDITMTHRVKEADGMYRFNLEMEVEL